MGKFSLIELPMTREDAMAMAQERIEWARDARERGLPGWSREWELTAKLLLYWAEGLPWAKDWTRLPNLDDEKD